MHLAKTMNLIIQTMKTLKLVTLTLILSLVFTACKENKTEKEEPAASENTETLEKKEEAKITIEKLSDSPAYADASLEMNTPDNLKIADGTSVDFGFTVSNYELTAQTDSPNATLLANSGKGQHIHFILNNQPYSAHYDPSFSKELPNGVHHLVAFLSRSYHESVKNANSVVVKKLEVGPDAKDTQGLDMEAPTLIYSRPKGAYTGKGTENVLLDFFVLNTTLSADGNKVRATINGQEFMITEWVPHVIKGLPKGEATIQLELLDAEGNVIPGPFNKVTRTIALKE